MNLIDHWVKGQGHIKIKYGTKSLVQNAPFWQRQSSRWFAVVDYLVVLLLCNNKVQ